MLGRAELRDLVDVQQLLEKGGDLERALRDAPLEDGGFSPVTLAWVLKSMNPTQLARALRASAAEMRSLSDFQASLVDRLLAAGAPD